MKFSCDKYVLQQAAASAARAAAAKSPLPTLEGLLIEAGASVRITGYDLKKAIYTTIAADIPEPGSVLIGARLFCEMLRRMPDGIVTGVLVVILVFVDFVELSQRRIPVQYTRRMIGRKMYGGSSTYLPLKINMSGVIPPIFASSILAIPTLIAQFGKSGQSWVDWINKNLANTTSVWYIALYALMIVFFCFFYTSITFNPDETADNMKEYGGFIPGIRAGNATSRYLNYVMNRLNTVGAVYLLFVALIPAVLIMALSLNSKLAFGGATVLVVAGVGLGTLRQAKAQTEQFQYTGFLLEGIDHKEG